MKTEEQITLIDRIIDELEMALQDAKDGRDDIETYTFEGCAAFHAREATRLMDVLNEAALRKARRA